MNKLIASSSSSSSSSKRLGAYCFVWRI